MPVLLCGVGVFALVAGLVMVGFGVPINEFSFGNTLISAGTTAIIGGLVIIALGVTVGQLRRIAEALAHQSPAGFAQPEISEPAASPPVPSGRIAPARARPDPRYESPAFAGAATTAPPVLSGERRPEPGAAPTLPNPEETSFTVDDEVSLSPQHPLNSPAPQTPDLAGRPRLPGSTPFGAPAQNLDERGPEAPPAWRSPLSPPPSSPQPRPAARFDAMWPADAKAAKGPIQGENKTNPHSANAAGPAMAKRSESETPKPRAVAVLKSGVVDGMGYTLYVDGSIEAELPQGTLRFASINELRSHLEKNS